MAEADWGDEGGEARPKKRRIPTWAWWTCGSGCAVMLLVGVGVAVLVSSLVKELHDSDGAWESVRAMLPYDQRPEGWEAHGFSLLGTGNYFLAPPQPGVQLFVQRFRDTPEYEAMFDPSATTNRGMLPFQRVRAPEAGTVEVQGRTVRCLRFEGAPPGFGEAPRDGSGYGIRIDLERKDHPVLVQLSFANVQAPVTAEQVTEVLAPFDVWRGR